jgi:hypothetical protein
VIAINMQETDRAVTEVIQRLVKGTLNETREASIERIVMRAKLGEDLRPVKAGVCVPFPRIDGVTSCVKVECSDCLTKGKVGLAMMRSQLDYHAGLQDIDEEHRKRNVFEPSRGYEALRRRKTNWMIERVQATFLAASSFMLRASAVASELVLVSVENGNNVVAG